MCQQKCVDTCMGPKYKVQNKTYSDMMLRSRGSMTFIIGPGMIRLLDGSALSPLTFQDLRANHQSVTHLLHVL